MGQCSLTKFQKLSLSASAWMFNLIPMLVWFFAVHTTNSNDNSVYQVFNFFVIPGKSVTSLYVTALMLLCFWHSSSWCKDSYASYRSLGIPRLSLLDCGLVLILVYMESHFVKETIYATFPQPNEVYRMFWLLIMINIVFYGTVSIYLSKVYRTDTNKEDEF